MQAEQQNINIGDLYQLYNFTKIHVAEARRSARAGHKDEARNFHRFLSNSHITRILKAQSFGRLPVDVALLEWEISQLEQECHPLAASDTSNDLAKIVGSLEIIACGINQILQQKGGAK